jgi:hydrogenase nickel incorporation protein HypA/HybF
MHELSLAQSMMELVADSAAREGIAHVKRVTVIIGQWSAVVPYSLTSCFDMLAAEWDGGLFQGAELIINQQPAMAECKACGKQFPAEETGLICPACGSGARLLSGTELAVDSYEGD